MIAGRETENGAANSLMLAPFRSRSCASSSRRVGSDSAAKVRSRLGSGGLIIIAIDACHQRA
jgi:hypothetical protein